MSEAENSGQDVPRELFYMMGIIGLGLLALILKLIGLF